MYIREKIKDSFIINPLEILPKDKAFKKVSMDCVMAHRKKIQDYSIEEYRGGSKFRNGDTLVARITPCLENGKTCQVDILDDGEIGFGSTEFIVLRGKPGITTNDFTYYVATGDYFRSQAISSMAGTSGRQRVQVDILGQKKVFIPSIEKQKLITNVLCPLDDKIEKNCESIGLYFQLIQSIYKSWFNDFAYPDNTGELENEEPKGWKRSNVFDNITDVAEKNKNNNDYPVLSVVKEGEFKASDDVFTKQVYSKSTANYKIVRHNQVAYNPARANIGSIAMLTDYEVGLVSPIYVVFETKESITPTFFYYYMKQPLFLENIKHHAIGTTRQNFPFEAFKTFEMVVPPIELQLRFEEVAVPIEQKITKLKAENNILAKIRDTLLPKLMSGELPMEVGEC